MPQYTVYKKDFFFHLFLDFCYFFNYIYMCIYTTFTCVLFPFCFSTQIFYFFISFLCDKIHLLFVLCLMCEICLPTYNDNNEGFLLVLHFSFSCVFYPFSLLQWQYTRSFV